MIGCKLAEQHGSFVLSLTFGHDSQELRQLACALQMAEGMATPDTSAADRAAMARAGVELLAVRKAEREAELERRAQEEPF